MKSFAIIRADSPIKVHTTLLDLRRYGQMVFSGPPKSISPDYADEILGKVMNRPLKNKCYAAALVSLDIRLHMWSLSVPSMKCLRNWEGMLISCLSLASEIMKCCKIMTDKSRKCSLRSHFLSLQESIYFPIRQEIAADF